MVAVKVVVLLLVDGAEAAVLFVDEEATTPVVLLETTSNALDRLALDLLKAVFIERMRFNT